MISFTVRMKFDEADRETVAEMLRQLSPASRHETGCINYIAHFAEGEPATVLIYEQYVDEAALEYHRNAPHFQRFAAGGLYKLKHERYVERLNAID